MYNRLIRTLIEVYGAIVRSEYHLQIPVGDHFHDIWIGNKGLKWRLQGMRYPAQHGPGESGAGR